MKKLKTMPISLAIAVLIVCGLLYACKKTYQCQESKTYQEYKYNFWRMKWESDSAYGVINVVTKSYPKNIKPRMLPGVSPPTYFYEENYDTIFKNDTFIKVKGTVIWNCVDN
jgi:hypothetical protein